MNLAELEADRLGLTARISATPGGEEIPSDSPPSHPWTRASSEARLDTLDAFVEAPTVLPGTGVTIPGVGDIGGGSLGAARLELGVGPDGSLHLSVLDSLVQGVQFDSPDFGSRLLIQDVRVGQTEVQRLRTAEGTDAVPAAEGFPGPDPATRCFDCRASPSVAPSSRSTTSGR